MKKIISLICVAAIVFSFAACSSSADNGKEFVSGSVSNNVYTNSFTGLKFAPGPDWTFSTEEEILEMMDLSKEYLSDGDKLNAELGKKKTIVDMQAMDSSTSENVILQFENLAMTIGGKSYSEEDYANATRETLEKTELGYTFSEYKTEELCGESYLTFEATADFQGIGVIQKMYLRKIGNYMFTITATTYDGIGSGIDAVMSLFSSAE